MSGPRIVIVGGGVAGVSVAYALTGRGATDVTVLESAHVASGSSGRSVGMVETQYFDPIDVQARAIGRDMIDRLEADQGLHFVRNGYLRPATSEAHLEMFARSVAVQETYGIDDAEVLDAAGVRRVAPPIDPERVVGGLWRPSDGYVDGHLFTTLLGRLAVEGGATIRQRRRVVSADKGAGDVWTLRCDDGSTYLADIVVNAAGAWAPSVARLLGLQIDVKPERHQALTLELGHDVDWVLPCVVDYIPGSQEDGLSLRHEGTSQLFATVHNERSVLPRSDPDSYAERIDENLSELIVELVMDRFPGLEDCRVGHGWTGLYPMTSDGAPLVGPDPMDRSVVHAAGGGGNGIQLATAMAEVAADWILHGGSTLLVDGHRWSPDRSLTAVEASA